ncbi:MAG: hypothetical protein ACO1OD_01160 [Croceibacterium sp.]
MLARLLALVLLLLPMSAMAQDGRSTLAGSWALEIGGATIFRFDLEEVPGKDGEWRGTWSRPSRFASNGDNFAQLQLPARQIHSMAGLEFDGTVEVSFPDPRPQAIPDIFRFRLIDSDAAEMTYVGTGLAPYVMQRVPANTALGPYREGATYSREVREEPEPESAPAAAAREPERPPAGLDDFRLPPSGVQGR